METYIIPKSKVTELLTMEESIQATENAFRQYGEKKVQMPPKQYLYFKKYNGDLRCMPAYMPDLHAAGIKAVNVHPDNHGKGLLTVMATIVLTDPETGYPIAIIDGTHITNMRTGAAGGVASKYLARKDSKVVGLIGTGMQAMTQIDAIKLCCPGIEEIVVFDIDPAAIERFSKYVKDKYGINARVGASVAETVRAADIVSTTTASRKPLFDIGAVKPGTHINAIGADAEGKQELDVSILKSSLLFIDDWDQASHSGEINVPLHNGQITREDITGELGDVVIGRHQGRSADDDITVFDSTGLAVQDIANASIIYNKAMKDDNIRALLQTVKLVD